MIRALPHILARVFGPPLMIAPAKLDKMLLGLHAAMLQRGSLLPEMAAREEAGDPAPAVINARGYRIERGVATVPVHGVLVRRAGQITPDSTEMQSYENVGKVLRNARNDSRVRGILLDVDSPGGEAGGIFDLASEVRAAAAQKPVWAIAQDDALSAAYLLASSAEKIWLTQTGAVGSIGVVALHADQSALDAAEGIKYSYIFRGSHKVDANPHEPLSSDARGVIQAEVDRLYTKLVDVVAKHRGVDPKQIRSTEAGVYFGEHAVSQGLADNLGTIDEAHAALAEHVQSKGARMDSTTTKSPAETGTDTTADNVIQLRVDEARKLLREEHTEIAAMCKIAGHPELMATFLADGLTRAQVMTKLQEVKVADAAKTALTAIDTSTQQPGVDAQSRAREAAAKRMTAMYSRSN